ncbi:MAG: YmdB family metallophosphoesterase [Helicobacteraceae bacterium]|jgi:metallophosphoesterase (TIGR00282 family)|nr:YmdB family metallophosphoesterase [Helicobacteraceae bacterium]
MKLMFIGDVVGKPGRRMIKRHLETLKRDHGVDFCAANGENIAHGFGITLKCADELFNAGVDLLTGGNHSWDKKEVAALFGIKPLIRPINVPLEASGSGIWRAQIGDCELAVINLIGFHNMGVVDNPFTTIERVVDDLINDGIKHIAIDFHAETTSEKNMLLKLLEGKVSVIYGTHTHIGTDDLLLAKGTGYVSDIGLTGIRNEVIGMSSIEPIKRYKTGIKESFKIEENGFSIFQAIVFELNAQGRCIDAYKIKAYDDEQAFISMRQSGGWN